MKKLLGIVVLGLLLSGNAYADNAYQNEIYQGCLETTQQLETTRAKQYCRCVSIMVTDKYTIDQLERAALMRQEMQTKMFSFAVNYCNINASAPGD